MSSDILDILWIASDILDIGCRVISCYHWVLDIHAKESVQMSKSVCRQLLASSALGTTVISWKHREWVSHTEDYDEIQSSAGRMYVSVLRRTMAGYCLFCFPWMLLPCYSHFHSTIWTAKIWKTTCWYPRPELSKNAVCTATLYFSFLLVNDSWICKQYSASYRLRKKTEAFLMPNRNQLQMQSWEYGSITLKSHACFNELIDFGVIGERLQD